MVEQTYEKTALIAVTCVAIALFIVLIFMVFKNNLVSLSGTNAQTFAQLNSELSQSAGSSVTGSYVKTFMGSNVNSSSVEIWIDGTQWDGSSALLNGILATDSYTQEPPVISNGKTVYKFTKT